jgi:hypothetical protein
LLKQGEFILDEFIKTCEGANQINLAGEQCNDSLVDA